MSSGSSARPAYRLFTAAELLAHEGDSVNWIVEPLIARGDLTILSGPPKESGKSTLSNALAVAVAQGHPFLGYPTKRCGVLILGLEEGERAIKRRLMRFGMQADDPIHIAVGRISAPGEIREILAQHADIGLVILDTLSRYWVGKIDDENSNTDVARVTAPLLDITRQCDVGLLMIHHDRKNVETAGSPKNIRGAGDLFGVVDQAWLLSPGTGNQRRMRIIGRYQDESPSLLTVALVDDEYQRVRVEGEAVARQEKVWAALADGAEKTEEDLMVETGLGRKPLQGCLKALMKGMDGRHVDRTGEGVRGKPYAYRRAIA